MSGGTLPIIIIVFLAIIVAILAIGWLLLWYRKRSVETELMQKLREARKKNKGDKETESPKAVKPIDNKREVLADKKPENFANGKPEAPESNKREKSDSSKTKAQPDVDVQKEQVETKQLTDGVVVLGPTIRKKGSKEEDDKSQSPKKRSSKEEIGQKDQAYESPKESEETINGRRSARKRRRRRKKSRKRNVFQKNLKATPETLKQAQTASRLTKDIRTLLADEEEKTPSGKERSLRNSRKRTRETSPEGGASPRPQAPPEADTGSVQYVKRAEDQEDGMPVISVGSSKIREQVEAREAVAAVRHRSTDEEPFIGQRSIEETSGMPPTKEAPPVAPKDTGYFEKFFII